jgi:predicted ATPase
MYLSAIRRDRRAARDEGFPWTLPLFAALEALEFRAPVTFLVGENGCGKSTLLEGLAAGMDAVAAGSRDLRRDETLKTARDFARGYRFVRRRHARVRLFLRAEDVFGFTKRIAYELGALRQIEADLREEFAEGSWGQRLATGTVAAQRLALVETYGADPDARSHGETFLHLLQRRLAPHGLYFLDEPETPLSPARVLGLLALLKDRVAQDCQFVIATHSPILMALPGAEILLLEGDEIRQTAYDDLEHVRLTRDFLNAPERFLRHL